MSKGVRPKPPIVENFGNPLSGQAGPPPPSPRAYFGGKFLGFF